MLFAAVVGDLLPFVAFVLFFVLPDFFVDSAASQVIAPRFTLTLQFTEFEGNFLLLH